jgi:hypothetical protein
MMFLLNLFKNLVVKILIKEIGNPLDFLTTPTPKEGGRGKYARDF